jgi:hypothetical protein
MTQDFFSNVNVTLNGAEFRRLPDGTIQQRFPKRCSTPDGITGNITTYARTYQVAILVCSTPDGITGNITRAQ